jgi:hypothetical protein
MWNKLLFLTLITAFFPWSLLVLLFLFGWDETVRIFKNVVLDAFGSTITAVVTILTAIIGLIFVALAIFWAYEDVTSFLIALMVTLVGIGIAIDMMMIDSPVSEIKKRKKLGYEQER